jgi:putative Mg2+ transporter-C (MgtC) family protein
MGLILQELAGGIPDPEQLARVVIRLTAAALVGAIIGLQRQHAGKPAGLRTHMLVALGSAVFVLVPLELQVTVGEIGRIVQGVAAGIGFIGAGAILKRTDEGDVQGLTTAAGIWLTAAIGVAIGLGGIGIALLATILTWFILSVVARIERRMSDPRPPTGIIDGGRRTP